MDEFITAIPFSLLLVASTGPVFFIVIETSISKGVRRAFCIDVGAVLADVVFITLASFSANSLQHSLKTNPKWFLLGGVVLVLFGFISFIQSKKNKKKIVYQPGQLQKGSYLSYIAKGFLLNIINIGVFIFWLGLVIVFSSKYEMNHTKTNTFLAYVLGIYLALDVVKIILAKQLKPVLTPRILYQLKQWVHVIVVLFGLFFMFQGVFPEQKQKLETKIEEHLK